VDWAILWGFGDDCLVLVMLFCLMHYFINIIVAAVA